MAREIARADILPPDAYAAERGERRRRNMALKKNRRISVGPFATFYFENYDTMLQQIHEMLHIERGGDAQIADELAAYNPLVPQGAELVATLMFEIDDEAHRRAVLTRLGDVELTAFMDVGEGGKVMARPEHDIERTTPEGKTSSVHFLHFPFTAAQVAAFRAPGTRALLGLAHENYSHTAALSDVQKQALSADFD